MGKVILTSIIVLCILVIVVMIILLILDTKQGKGFLGELRIKIIIGKTKNDKKYVINNYMISVDGKSSQIDHILINPNGIFVIETKNYSGRIYGNTNQLEWTQVLQYGSVKNHFYNPVKQNNTHVYNLAKTLPENSPLIPIVVFVKNNTAYIEAENVIGVSDLRRFINTPNSNSLSTEQMFLYYNCLIENESNISTQEHVNQINQMIVDIDNNICPRCGSNLVERNGKYGKFYGCEKYPECKFTKK